MKTIVVLFAGALLLHSCTYAISPGTTDKADKTIPFEKLQANPEAFKGKLLILGGTIARITTVNQGALIDVIQKRLDYWGKPLRTNRTGGRFLVFHPGELNAMIYAPGVDITIAGEALGVGSPMLGDKQYDYPLLHVKELKLWERERGSRDTPRWIDPLYDPAGQGRPE